MRNSRDEWFVRTAATLGLIDSAASARLAALLDTGEADSAADAARKLRLLTDVEITALETLATSCAAKRGGADLGGTRQPAHPRTLGAYELIEPIGRGAFGVIYSARPSGGGPEVALKILPPDVSQETDTARFRREIETIRRLDHPNIVKIYDYGEADGYQYYAMEFVRGRSLRGLINERGRISPFEAAEYIRDAASGLACMHRTGIIHRDVKPSNLMVTNDGGVKVVDFGLAISEAVKSLTSTGVIPGTPAYMSPEQIESGGTLDARTDVYSLGVTLYETLCGRRPFDGDTPFDIMHRILHGTPEALEKSIPGLPRGIVDITVRAMARHRDERYKTMQALADDLTKFIDGTVSLRNGR